MAQKQYKPVVPVKSTSTAAKSPSRAAEPNPAQFVFHRSNYRLLIISIAVVAFGFILMSGTTDIYSNTKIVIAPLIVLSGFALGFFAIFKK